MQRFVLAGCLSILFVSLAMVQTATATDHKDAPRSVCDVIKFQGGDHCAKPAPCKRDASTCVLIDNTRPTYTAQGVHAFLSLFRVAAEKGVENATIRALNGAKVGPACTDCEQK